MTNLNKNKRFDVEDYSDVHRYIEMCKFSNCKHQTEPGCAVREALVIGKLSEDKLKRYFKSIKREIFKNDKKKYDELWNNFTLNLSKASKENFTNEKKKMESIEQETTDIQNEVYYKLEGETLNIIIRRELKEELKIVENVIREAFWNVYKPGCDEHLMVHQLHTSKNFIKELDFVTELDGEIVGNIVCSKAMIKNDETEHEIICIGPIGVIPEYRSRGIGSSLMEKVIENAKTMGITGIALYGNPDYYHRFGFVNAEKFGITTPDGNNFEEFMVLELHKGSLEGISGKCYEDKSFEIKPDDLLAFDKGFDKKEKRMVGVDYHDINPCGTYCYNCEDLGIVCDGCRNRVGMPLWYKLYNRNEPCIYYKCCEENKIHDCSACNKVPCGKYFIFPDPNMGDAEKEMWLELRMNNLMEVNKKLDIKLANNYAENDKRYNV